MIKKFTNFFEKKLAKQDQTTTNEQVQIMTNKQDQTMINEQDQTTTKKVLETKHDDFEDKENDSLSTPTLLVQFTTILSPLSDAPKDTDDKD